MSAIGLSQSWRVPGAEAKEWARENIRGQWICPLGSITDDDEIDEAGIRTCVDRALELRIGGLAYSVLYEPWSSTHEERRRGLEVFLDQVAGRLPVYATVTDHSIKETVRLGQHALDSGAAIVMINCPYEHVKSEQQIIDFFRYVCARLDGPISLYNTPHSGYILSPELIAELAEISNVCALKNAIGDFEHSTRVFGLVGDKIVVCDPTESRYLDNIENNHQQAMFSTTASHLMQSPSWQPIADYAEAAEEREFGLARTIRASIDPLREVWSSLYTSLWGGAIHAHHPIAQTKYWQDLMGMPAGPPRPPVGPLTEKQRRKLRFRLRESGMFDRLGVEIPI